MRPLVVAYDPAREMAAGLAQQLDAEVASVKHRLFPDGETYLRIDSECKGRTVLVVASLDRPDAKLLPILFLADTLKELGATEVGLVAPYLAYMRQDARFKPGECVTSTTFARLLSEAFDWLVTMDPHLHRYSSLNEIYTIPTSVISAAPAIGDWVSENVQSPVLIGPDAESRQWVQQVGERIGVPWTVYEKVRSGDRAVSVDGGFSDLPDGAPVLIDDIISTGRTCVAVADALNKAGRKIVACVGVHALFAGDAAQIISSAGFEHVVTTNTVPHRTNEIDVTALVAEGIRAMWQAQASAVAS